MSMLRILLIVAVIAIGYDAVVYHGAYTRSAWASVVGATEHATDKAREIGQNAREDIRSNSN